MISFDTETTGIDFRHGARPFFVTTCTGQGEITHWEWDVDPETREPEIPDGDLKEIADYVFGSGPAGPIGEPDDREGGLILQNAKFDFTAMDAIDFWEEVDEKSAWEAVHDTLLGAHLLASNRPKDLTSLAMQYLGEDILPMEESLGEYVQECRRLVRSRSFVERYGEWAIATQGRPDMPSAGEKTWKFDMWLPRAVAKALGYDPPVSEASMPYAVAVDRGLPVGHPYWTALRDYSNADSACTVEIWKRIRAEINRRGLWKIYSERRKVLSIAYRMEKRGVTLSGERLLNQRAEYEAESARLGSVMVNIAASYSDECPDPAHGPPEVTDGKLLAGKCATCGGTGQIPFKLVLPKGASPNGSLRRLCFDKMELPQYRGKKSKTSAPTLDKEALENYRASLPKTGKPFMFVNSLVAKRKRDTAIAYMQAYQRFWVEVKGCPGWYVLHPSLNPTGTDTLRWSCSNPNEQNISKKEGFNLRYTFGPPPGWVWYSFDAMGIEDRLPAYRSKQQELIDIFERSNEPPFYGSNHLLRFSIVYPDIWAKELKEVGIDRVGPHCKKKYAATYYQWCKNGGFAVQYGAVEKADGWGTADRAFHKQYAHRLLKERLSKLEDYNQYWIRYAEKHGYVETIPDLNVDPTRGYPVLCTRTEYGGIKPTVPLNYHIQSSAMWWTMKAMIRVQYQLDEWEDEDGFDGYIPLQVHDELVVAMRKSGVHPSEDFAREKENGGRLAFGDYKSTLGRARVIQSLMAMGGDDFGIPTPVGVEYNEHNWSEGVTLS